MTGVLWQSGGAQPDNAIALNGNTCTATVSSCMYVWLQVEAVLPLRWWLPHTPHCVCQVEASPHICWVISDSLQGRSNSALPGFTT